MRTIKFRGKRIDNDGWVYGDLLTNNPTPQILAFYGQYLVDEDTIGQYTGLLDKNDKEIFEGDILEIADEMYAKVVWNKEKASFEYEYLHSTQIANAFYEFNMPYLSIVGNIYDNKELMKGE